MNRYRSEKKGKKKVNKTRSKLSETQNFLASPRMYALNANAPNSIKPRRRFKAARQWITAPLKTSRSVWTDVFNAPTLLLLSRNSSAYLQYQRSAGEVTIQEAERKQRGTHERTKNYAQTSPHVPPRELLLPSSRRGVASTAATVRRNIAPSLFLLSTLDLLALERSKGNDTNAAKRALFLANINLENWTGAVLRWNLLLKQMFSF